MTKSQYRIVNEGMGGFLNPPTHPEHKWSVHSEYELMSLGAAIDANDVPEAIKAKARALLSEWRANRPTLTAPEIQDWVKQVLGYFAGCYKGQDKVGNESWNASELRIEPDIDPVLNQDLHAGVRHIREYYPEFKAEAAHFAGAYWGKKPVAQAVTI